MTNEKFNELADIVSECCLPSEAGTVAALLLIAKILHAANQKNCKDYE